MDDVRLGRTLRTIRIRAHLRQSDVARRASLRRETVSRIERGGAGRIRLDDLRRLAVALGASADVAVRWRGADLDRVVNAAHADLHESVVSHLAGLPGWTWRPEVSFSVYGERGVIDILAWHAMSRSLLIIELKTELVDPQSLVATMDRRVRLGRAIVAPQGWEPRTLSAWVIVIDSSTNRRRARRHANLLQAAYPRDGRAMRRWLREPVGPIAALSFWSDVRAGPVRRTISQTKRVRPARTTSRSTRVSVEKRTDAARALSPDAALPSNGPHTDI